MNHTEEHEAFIVEYVRANHAGEGALCARSYWADEYIVIFPDPLLPGLTRMVSVPGSAVRRAFNGLEAGKREFEEAFAILKVRDQYVES